MSGAAAFYTRIYKRGAVGMKLKSLLEENRTGRFGN